MSGPRFLELIIENAYNIKGRNVIKLDNMGLVNFVGRNYDAAKLGESNSKLSTGSDVSSNGSGKSTSVKCLLRVLYGEKVTKHEKVSESLNGKNFLIGVKVENRGIIYEAYEVKKHSDFSKDGLHCFQTIDGKREPFGRKNASRKLREDFTEQAVGMSFDEFVNSTVITQGSTHVLIKGTPQERVEFISKMFGLDAYDELHNKFKLKLDAVEAEIKDFTDSRVKVGVLKERLSELDPKGKGLAKTRRLIAEFESEKKSLSSKRKALRTHLEEVMEAHREYVKYKNLVLEIQKYETEHSGLDFSNSKTSIKVLSERVDEVTRTLAKAEGNNKAFENLRVLKKQRKNLLSVIPSKFCNMSSKDMKTKRVKLEAKEQSETSSLRALVAQRDLIESVRVNLQQLEQIGMVEADYDEAKAAMEEYEAKEKEQEQLVQKYLGRLEVKEGVDTSMAHCPTCGSEIDAAKVEKEVQKLTDMMVAAEKKRKEYRRIHQRNKLFCETQDIIEKNKLDINVDESTLKEMAERIKSIRTKIEKYEEIEDNLKRVENLTAQIASIDKVEFIDVEPLEKKLKSLKSKLEILQEYRSLTKSLPQTAPKKPKLDQAELKNQLEKLDNSLEALVKKLSGRQAKVDEYDRITDALQSLKPQVKKLKSLEKEQRVLKALCLAYGKRGLKVKKIREIVEEIKTHLPVWVSTLFPEKGFKIETVGNEKQIGFMATQTFKVDGKQVTKSFDIRNVSGGERTRVMIALLLTLMDIVAEEKKSNMVILDELEGGLDPVNRNLVSDQLIPLLKNKKPTICVISHSLNMPRRTFNYEVVFERRNFQTTITTTKLRDVNR